MLSKMLIGRFGCWKTIVTRRRSRVGSINRMSTSSRRMAQFRRRGQLGQPVQPASRVSSCRSPKGRSARATIACGDSAARRFSPPLRRCSGSRPCRPPSAGSRICGAAIVRLAATKFVPLCGPPWLADPGGLSVVSAAARSVTPRSPGDGRRRCRRSAAAPSAAGRKPPHRRPPGRSRLPVGEAS